MKFRYYLALFPVLACPLTANSAPNSIDYYGAGAIVAGVILGASLSKKLETAYNQSNPDNLLEDPEEAQKEKIIAAGGTLAGLLTVIHGLKFLGKSKELTETLAKISTEILKRRFFGKKPLRLQQTLVGNQAHSAFYLGLFLTAFGSFCTSFGITKAIA